MAKSNLIFPIDTLRGKITKKSKTVFRRKSTYDENGNVVKEYIPEITEEGNIIMRGDEYKTSSPVKTEEELEEKYNIFKEKAEILLKKKEVNYYTKNNINNTLNIFIVIALSIIYVIVLILAIREVLSLNLFTASILFAILSSSLIPNIKARFEQAKNFLKRKFKK